MSDLTQRAKARLAQAEIARLTRIQQQEDKRKALPPPSYAAGFAGGVQKVLTAGQGKSNAQVITNGVLGVGDRVVKSGNLIDAMPRIRPDEPETPKTSKRAGVVMWLDANWYSTLNPVSLPPMDSRNINFAKELIKFTKAKKIYVLNPSDPRAYNGDSAGAGLYTIEGSGAFGPALTELDIEVIKVSNIADASGVFILQLLQPEARLTDAEFTKLRTLAKRCIVCVTGEWESWVTGGYNEHLFRGLRFPSRVRSTTYSLTSSYAIRYPAIASKLPTNIILGNAAGFFTGLKANEIFAANGSVSGPPVFAYLQNIK